MQLSRIGIGGKASAVDHRAFTGRVQVQNERDGRMTSVSFLPAPKSRRDAMSQFRRAELRTVSGNSVSRS